MRVLKAERRIERQRTIKYQNFVIDDVYRVTQIA